MMVLTEIEAPMIAIVHFRSEEAVRPRIVYYQVTIDPDNFSPGGFVRFGDAQGDEITGWQPQEDIVIDEILARGVVPTYARPRHPIEDAA